MDELVAISTQLRWAARKLGLHGPLAALVLGCGPKAALAPGAQTAPTAPNALEAASADAGGDEAPPAPAQDLDAELPPANDPEEVALRWFEALRRPSPKLLGDWSRYPFFLHDTGTEGTCGHGAAADAGQVARLLSCMFGNRALLRELRENPELSPRALTLKELPTWARRWRNEAPSDATPVLIEIAGHGNASHFVLIVRDGGACALWKETVFDAP